MNIRAKIEACIAAVIPAVAAALSRLREQVQVSPTWFTYFPFFGWIYPFIARKNDAFAMNHGRQAFVLAVVFTVFPILVTFSTVFIPISYRGIKLAVAIMVYLSHLAYFALCAWGFIKMKENVPYEFPLIAGYAKRLNV